MQVQKFTLPFPPLQVRAGVLVVDGYGVSLRVLCGKLVVEDGIGEHRRSIRIDRAGSGLERLVLLGKTGSVTLESLAWLRAMGASLIHLDLDDHVLTHSAPFGYDGYPIRRAQALAVTNGLDVDLARRLIQQKVAEQRTNLVRLKALDLAGFDRMHAALETARTIEEVRLCEAKCAAIYWNAWTNVSIRLRPRDVSRVPVRWTRYETRKSTLTGGPRAATNPINSLLNYTYSLLESEARLALLSAGLCPTLGILHSDQRNRDSFALDAMEPVRPVVDAFILDLLEERVLTSRDFVEMSNGVCRLRAPMTHDLALTLPRWRQLVEPVVADLARAFRGAMNRPVVASVASPNHDTREIAKPTPLVSPLTSTPRKERAVRPYASKAWTPPRPEPLLLTPNACARCNEPVVKRRRKHCDKCIPGVRADHARRIVVAARAALAVQTAAGEDPRKNPEMNQRRGQAIAQGHRRNREGSNDHANDGRDEMWFRFNILRQLDEVPLSQIAAVTGLSLPACSRFRAGKRIPHKRHWTALEIMLKDHMG
jgi:CRISPR-associated endonuclease Cas1